MHDLQILSLSRILKRFLDFGRSMPRNLYKKECIIPGMQEYKRYVQHHVVIFHYRLPYQFPLDGMLVYRRPPV